MSNTSAPKKGFGVYLAIAAAVLAAAAGVFMQVQGGQFGAMARQCYSLPAVILLIATLVVVVVLVAIKRYGLASLAAAAMPGIALCCFAVVHDAYWYVADVFIAIDEKGFDPNFLVFAGLVLGAFILGEIAVYAPKTKKVKA